VAETVTALESRPATLESDRIELGARELAPYIPDEKDTLLPQIASPAATGGSMAEEDKRVLVKALLDLKGEVDALSERVKALEGGAVRQIPEQVGSDRLGAENDDDAEWQEQSEELSIRKNTGELIERALEKHGGNVKAAAAELGISERTVYRKLAKNKK
jgi:transcriptional regulator of acetoin/glycerol metabolism